jgi:polysaccharide export outer membrane protein
MKCALVLATALSLGVVGHAAARDSKTAAEAPSPGSAAYRLGPGDRLRIVVFDEDALTGEFVVSNEGVVALPLLGDMKAGGLTVPELQEAVKASLSHGYLTEPRVAIEVLNFRPFYILGEVNKPGEYPYAQGLTPSKAVALAGGFTYRASTGRVYVRHGGENAEHAETLADGVIQPGDTLRIPQRFF